MEFKKVRNVLARSQVIADDIKWRMTQMQNVNRWPSFTSDSRFNQLNKMGLGMVITYSISQIYQEKTGRNLDETKFPKLAILEGMEKVTISNTPSAQLRWLSEYDVQLDNLVEMTVKKNFQNIPDDIWEFLNVDQSSIEARVFRCAGKLASLLELEELSVFINSNSFQQAKDHKEKELDSYKDIMDLIEDDWKIIKPVIEEISSGLRNQVRWMMYCRQVNCSVLGHLFETALMAYIMSLELGNSEELASRHFKMGIFHDIAEAWTLDMPSPLKDAVDGLRVATEKYEEAMMEEHFYNKVPSYIASAVKAVDFERPENAESRALIKGADYASASLECWKNYLSGTRDFNFRRAALDTESKMLSGTIQVSQIGALIVSQVAAILDE